MKNVIGVLACSALWLGLIAPDGARPAATDQDKKPATEANVKKPDAALVSLWVVRFDPTLPRDRLPFDVQAARKDPMFAQQTRKDAKGRIVTAGWASQISETEPIVDSGLFLMTMKNGQLQTILRTPDAGSPPWTVVAAPRLLVQAGQRASVSVGRNVSHLVKQPDGCLKLEESSGAMEGVTVDLMLAWIKPEDIRFSEITLRASSVAAREPIPEVPLEVGKPIMETRETNLGITLDKGKVGVIPLPERADEAPILVFLTASPEK